MRRSMLAVLALLGAGAIVAACASLDGLSGSDAEDASADVAPQDEAGPIVDASIPDVDPDAIVNPAAGLGVFVLSAVRRPDASVLVAPARIEPQDGGVKLLACPRDKLGLLVDKGGLYPDALGPWGMRVFYEPMNPGRAMFVFPTGNGPPNSGLTLAHDDSTCDGGAPLRLLSQGVSGASFGPSFSDDGKRVAFLASDGFRVTRLVTAATDGPLDQFELRDAVASNSTLSAAPPAWLRDSEGLKVVWSEYDADGNRLVRFALDKAVDSDPPVLLDCGKVFFEIRQIGIFRGLGGKTFLAFSADLNDPDGGAPTQRGIFAVDHKLPCDTRTLLFPDAPQSYSADFAIAPDGDRMVHVANRAASSGDEIERNRIWIGSVTKRSRTLCSNPPDGTYDVGPQWINGGAQLVFTRRAQNGNEAVVMIADVSGDTCSNERPLTSTGPGATAHTAKNGGCAASPGAGSSYGGQALALGAAVLASLARRRRGASREESRTPRRPR